MNSDESNTSSTAKARSKALSLLARREHSVRELHAKLIDKGFDSDLVGSVIEQLAESGMQSDTRFTESYSRSRTAKGFGPVRILMELRDKGIAAELCEEHVDKHHEQWQQRAEQQLQKKFSRLLAQDMKELAAMKHFLQYRGFDSHWVALSTTQEQ